MHIKITSKVKENYLLIEVFGRIVDILELKQLTRRFFDEIMEYSQRKVIIDERKTQFPLSLEHSTDIVKFLTSDFPDEIKLWKIAFVMDTQFKAIGDFFQFQSQKSGYDFKVFSTMEDAREFINVNQ